MPGGPQLDDDKRVSTEIPVDDDTRAALLLFNERLEASAAVERAAKRVSKAERAKNEAANRVRKVGEDPNATPEAKAEAEAAYKDAVAAYTAIKENPDAEEPKPTPEPAPATAAEDAPVADEATDAEPTEASADEQPAQAATTEDDAE